MSTCDRKFVFTFLFLLLFCLLLFCRDDTVPQGIIEENGVSFQFLVYQKSESESDLSQSTRHCTIILQVLSEKVMRLLQLHVCIYMYMYMYIIVIFKQTNYCVLLRSYTIFVCVIYLFVYFFQQPAGWIEKFKFYYMNCNHVYNQKESDLTKEVFPQYTMYIKSTTSFDTGTKESVLSREVSSFQRSIYYMYVYIIVSLRSCRCVLIREVSVLFKFCHQLGTLQMCLYYPKATINCCY